MHKLVIALLLTVMGACVYAGTVTIFNPSSGTPTVCTSTGSGSSTVVICP